MSSIQERLQLKRVPLDTWNIREQLCLASAVVRSGDQNWMSVSRSLKTIGEPNRPSDWYSQKSCAAQYGVLLEHVETPKRKKRNSEGAVETPQESILKKLTQERIVEIQKNLVEMNQQYEQLKNEVAEARNPATSDERIKEIWTNIEASKRAKERENARRAALLKEREERRARADRGWQPSTPTSPVPPTPGASPTAGSALPPAPPASPLLTSLLKSSPVVTTPQHMTHPANVVETVSPSVTAPTLSMLLEKAPTTTTHESKYAAIEHIKSQLQQIEHQLNANTPPPVPLAPVPTPPAPALDIDDIEIKAEDVYAFRDVDIHIPPVTTMHKGINRTADKPVVKKDDAEENLAVDVEDTTEHVTEDVIKEEPITVEDVGEILPEELETVQEEMEEEQQIPTEREPTPESEMRVSFPEVKFPTTEIKVIHPEDQKIKEEIKEPEVPPPEPEKLPEVVEEEEEEIVVEEKTVVPVVEEVIEQPRVPTPPPPPLPLPQTETQTETQPLEEPPATDITEHLPLPADIPLPPEPVELQEQVVEEQVPTESPLPPEPEVPKFKEEPVEVNLDEQEAEIGEQKYAEVADGDEMLDIKKEDDAEDLIPLKQMIKEECAVLRDPRVEETHTETDDDTPMELSREEEKDGKKKRDYSRKKKPDSRTCSGSESAAEASAPESPSANDAERQHRLWKKSVMLVYSRLCAHKYASLFLRPISDEEAPGYSAVTRRPMDLSTIRRNIDNGVIRTTAQFQRDVLLMLSNALMYNSSEHSVYAMAKEMHEEAACQLGMLLAAQAHAGLCAAPPQPAPRKRRRPDSPLALSLSPRHKRHH